jgi:hypothetical protein
MPNEQVPKEELLQEVDLTTEQVERAERLYHDIWSDADAHDAAREIIYLRDQLEQARKDTERLNSNTILIRGRDEFGEPTSCIHKGLDLRAAIDAAMEESH